MFADDPTILGRRAEIEEGTRAIKRVMKQFEKKKTMKTRRRDWALEKKRAEASVRHSGQNI